MRPISMNGSPRSPLPSALSERSRSRPAPRALLPLIALLLAACGGAPAPSSAPDEVTATWTAGDDAPLEEDDAEK